MPPWLSARLFIGADVVPTKCYGPRIYEPGTVMLGHMDQYPSHTIGISVCLSGPEWPMELQDQSIDCAGTFQPCTSPAAHIVYEGCRMLHARSSPAPARYIAAFFHYMPKLRKRLDDH